MKQGNKTKLRILEVANTLFYQQGYNSTSFAHIVDATGLSKGNITYHFKNKQLILEGVVERRLAEIDQLLMSWNNETSSPSDRLIHFFNMLLTEQDNLQQFGCPMGTLTGEFSKNQPELYEITLPMFECFRSWLTEQFLLLDEKPKLANEHAMELLAKAQGASVMAHVFKDKDFLQREVQKFKDEIYAQ